MTEVQTLQVLIVGASKGIGLETVRQATAAGHHVRAFARSAGSISFSHPNLEKLPGDALNRPDVDSALIGVSVVIQALGVGLGTCSGPCTYSPRPARC